MGIPKIMIFFAIVLSTILYWAASNVCKYNFALEKQTERLNIVTAELDPTLGNAKLYYYEELNCNDVDLAWDIDRVVSNFKTVSVIIYQELNTDIKGANILNYHSLLISNGVHREEIKDKGVGEVSKQYEAIVNYIQSDLKW